MRLKTNIYRCLMPLGIILVAVLGLAIKSNGQASCPSYSSATPPPPYDACVQAVFDGDAFCCNTTWDAFCQGAYDPAPCAGGGGTVINMPVSGSTTTCNASFFDSGGSAANYANNENRVFTICPSNPGDLIQVNFSAFNIESGFDFLTIYDGNSTAAPSLGTFTGTTSPGIVTGTSANGCLTFEFTSDGSVTSTGWASTVICLTPSTTLDMPPSGSFLGCGLSFFDSGGSGADYTNGENNVVTLCPSSGTDRIQITFSSFNLESGFDFLSVYDGTTTSATLLGTYTGSSIPPVLTATNGTGCLTFEFTSDGSVTAAGWQSSIACVLPGAGSGPIVAGDCNVAANVCTNLSFSVDPSGFGATDELFGNAISNPLTNPNGTNLGCLLSGELHSTWMIVNIASNGNLQFSFGADGGVNCYDWIMWEYDAATCANIINNTLAPVACNWNGACESFTGMASPLPAGGDATNFETPLNVSCGEQYIVCFSNYSSALTSVPLNFFGTATVACGVFNPVTVNSPTVCEGQCANLTASGATTYTWAPSADLSTTTGPNTTACPGGSGTFTYAVTGTGSCGVGTTSATVTVLPSSDPSCILLGTKLREFKGFLNANNGVELMWQTETEHETDWFVIEKSFNGTDFSELKRLKAAGNANYILNYGVIDANPSPIVTYYRLRLIHTSGVVIHSNTIAVEGKEGSGGISLYPNPAKDQVIIYGADLENASFSLVNALGQSISIKPFSNSGQKAAFDVSGIVPGLYYVVVSFNGVSKTKKLLIENR